MEEVLGIILLLVTIIVSLPIVGMMLLFAIFMDYGVEDKKENLKNIKKKDWVRRIGRMKKEKHIKNSQDIKDMNGEPKVRHSMSMRMGEERSGFKRYCWESRERRKGRK